MAKVTVPYTQHFALTMRRMREDGLDLRGKEQCPLLKRKVEWLHADAVAHQRQYLQPFIPQPDRVIA